MTLEELKGLAETPGDIAYETLGARLADLAPEILALVEAAGEMEWDYDNGWENIRPVQEALDAFNAKLASL